MYLPALKNAIQNLEEKQFYTVSIMYLEQLGYSGLSVVDGTGDGGRDVICSRPDLRIQLSVRRDWDKKINEEAANTLLANRRHLIYVTNKIISPAAEQEFLIGKFTHKGNVDVSIHDLRRIATTLARPGAIKAAYEAVGMSVSQTLTATLDEIALSTVLLFSDEARDLRDNFIAATVRAYLLKNPDCAQERLVPEVAAALPGQSTTRAVTSALDRLRTAGKIEGTSKALHLSTRETATMEAAEAEFLAAVSADVKTLSDITGLDKNNARRLLDLALELLVRDRDLSGSGPAEEALRSYIAQQGLSRRRPAIYEALSRCSSAKIRQFGSTLDHMFSTNTFDIYRSLGTRTNIVMVLDSSVAMPMLFGLEFGGARSRYGLAATALRDACKAHGIQMIVPQCYVNEIAFHGTKALEFVEVHESLPGEARSVLRASGNAYLNHFSHIWETTDAVDKLDLKSFLKHFGIEKGRSFTRIENKVASILDAHSITRQPDERYDPAIFNRIADEKPNEPKVIVQHDAVVCTMMVNTVESGYILATWDRTLINIVEDVARVFADTPARIIDFLSMARGADFEADQNIEMISSLLHIDEKPAQALANKIQQIRTADQGYKLRALADAARQRIPGWELKTSDIDPFLREQ